ncbi:caspase family protein [bacterium]|nr:caspase family protein [bacterium]
MTYTKTLAWLMGIGCWCGYSAPARAEGQTWGVVVGIDDYVRESIQDLRYASADAKLFSRAMVDLLHVPKDHLFVFTSDSVESSQTPTRLNLVYRLDWLRKNAKAEDKVVFFFAGHGANVDNESFLMTEESDNRSVETLKASALGTKDLAGLLQRSPASQTLTIIDACRNDPSGKPTAGAEEKMPQLVIGGANQECAGLFSCSVGQRSWEWDANKHGFFSYHLVEGMQGGAVESDGRVTLQSISNYLAEVVPASTRQAVKASQIPFVYYVGPSMKNWVLATAPPGAAKSKGPVVARLDQGVAKQDLVTAQKVELESKLRIEEARRREVEVRMEALEKKFQSQAAPSEDIQKLALSKELALKELLETRKQLDDARVQLAARGGTSAEADLVVAEKEQLRAENKVLQAKIAVLEGKLQQGGLSLARSFRLESDPAREVQVAEREQLAGRQATPEHKLAAAEARIALLLGESTQLRERMAELNGLLVKDLIRLGLLTQEAELKVFELGQINDRQAQDFARLSEDNTRLANELAALKMQGRIWQNRYAQAQQAEQIATLEMGGGPSSGNSSPELQHAKDRFKAAREQNARLLEELGVLLKHDTFRRRWISNQFHKINSAPGMGDILDIPINTGPELQDLP